MCGALLLLCGASDGLASGARHGFTWKLTTSARSVYTNHRFPRDEHYRLL
jgi:hypothetical protein